MKWLMTDRRGDAQPWAALLYIDASPSPLGPYVWSHDGEPITAWQAWQAFWSWAIAQGHITEALTGITEDGKLTAETDESIYISSAPFGGVFPPVDFDSSIEMPSRPEYMVYSAEGLYYRLGYPAIAKRVDTYARGHAVTPHPRYGWLSVDFGGLHLAEAPYEHDTPTRVSAYIANLGGIITADVEGVRSGALGAHSVDLSDVTYTCRVTTVEPYSM